MPDPQIMCFSKSKPISGYTVCLWPQNYQKSLATPCTFTDSLKQNPQSDTKEILFLFLLSIFDSSLSSQLSCTKTGSHLYFFYFMKPSSFPSASFTSSIFPILPYRPASLHLFEFSFFTPSLFLYICSFFSSPL